MIVNGGRQRILIVDDSIDNLNILNSILESEYSVIASTTGEQALKIASSKTPPDLILLDVIMPGMDGFEVCRLLKDNPITKKIPVLFVTALGEIKDESTGFSKGCVDYITKPVSQPIVLARVKTQLSLYDQNRLLEEKVNDRTKELNDTRLEIIRRLGHAAEYKDKETGNHIIRMSKIAQIISLGIGLPDAEAELILNSSPMHDVGKIGIPDSILLKPGSLDEDEWKVMKTHSHIGYKIIGEHKSELLSSAALTALSHHEKWDGTGYPRGTKGEDIPLVGRIAAVADVFDALTSKRPYKEPWPLEKAVGHISTLSGSHFDPSIVGVFIKHLPDIIKVMEDYQDV